MVVNTRSAQLLVVASAVTLLLAIVVMFGGERGPSLASDSDPHAGAKHHSAEPHAGDRRAPVQPFFDARPGEWIAVETRTQLANGQTVSATSVTTIEAVTAREVRLVHTERGATPAVTRTKLPRTLTLDQLVGNDTGDWKLHSLVIVNDVCAVGGKALPCTRLAFALDHPLEPGRRAQVRAAFSPHVPVDGLVELTQTFDATSLQTIRRVTGFGTP